MRRSSPLSLPLSLPAARGAGAGPLLLAGLLAVLAIPLPAQARREAAEGAGTPPEVAAFVERRAACRRWDGEDGADAERAAETARERFRLKCNTIASDERRLRARYVRSPDALEALGDPADD